MVLYLGTYLRPHKQQAKAQMKTPASAEVTKLLLVECGRRMALEQLLPVVYRELHRMARRYMAGERQTIRFRLRRSSTKPT